MLLGYITVGTNDLSAASRFYDSLLAEINAKRIMEELEESGFLVWAKDMESTGFSVTKPFNKQAAMPGNGNMAAFSAGSAEKAAMYEKALALGGSSEGEPGHRGGGFYAAYFRDLDGNKLNAYCIIDENHPEY